MEIEIQNKKLKEEQNKQIQVVTDYFSYIPATVDPLSSDIGLIRGEKTDYLFDVGNSEEGLALIRQWRRKDCNCYAVLSHFHPDHKGNLDELIREGLVDKILLSEYTKKHLPDGVRRIKNIPIKEKESDNSELCEDSLEKTPCEDTKLVEDFQKTDFCEDINLVDNSKKSDSCDKKQGEEIIKIIDTRTIRDDGIRLEIFPIPCSHAKGCLGMTINRCYTLIGDVTYPTRKQGRTVYNAQLLKDEIDVLSKLETEYLLVSHHKPLLQSKESVLRMLTRIYQHRQKNEVYI